MSSLFVAPWGTLMLGCMWVWVWVLAWVLSWVLAWVLAWVLEWGLALVLFYFGFPILLIPKFCKKAAFEN